MQCWTTQANPRGSARFDDVAVASSRSERGSSDGTAGRFADGVDAIRLIDALGAPGFGATALRELDALLPVAYLTAYRKRRDAPIAMLFTGSARRPDVTARCWRIYREGPHMHDRALGETAQRANARATAWCHLTVDQIDDPRHRVEVYERHDLLDRLSIVDAADDGGWFALNLFRVGEQGHFSDRELATIERTAPLLMAFARRHIALIDATRTPPQGETNDRLHGLREALRAHCTRLTERELDVCARLALGMTYDGIACDLGIAVTSAKTYRNRAFERLDIQFRSQLMPLGWGGAS